MRFRKRGYLDDEILLFLNSRSVFTSEDEIVVGMRSDYPDVKFRLTELNVKLW